MKTNSNFFFTPHISFFVCGTFFAFLYVKERTAEIRDFILKKNERKVSEKFSTPILL